MPHIILIGTLDTKLQEFLYLHQQLKELSTATTTPLRITFIDCGRTPTQHPAVTIPQQDLITKYGTTGAKTLAEMPRGEVIRYMIDCTTTCVKELIKYQPVHGILSAGGSGGTSLVSAVMREAAPLGMPKLIVSTVASGDTGPIVGETDITMMYPVVDIAGTNEMLRDVLRNAAGAMVGMTMAYERTLVRKESMQKNEAKIQIGITMFGVTTPCVSQITQHLTENYPVEVYSFHATGHGGMAMERLVQEGRLDAVLDLTTTEICDHLYGGNMSAGPKRLEAALKRNIPNIISLGATDMVNFGAKSTVPEAFKNRLLLEHNPMVTLMRTTKEECESVGAFIVEKIKSFVVDPQRVEVWVPRGGVSIISKPGEIFADEEANATLADTIKEGLKDTGIRVVEDTREINDPGFALDIAESLMKIISARS
jgi:uncharacterized protein (UPF0261 family)